MKGPGKLLALGALLAVVLYAYHHKPIADGAADTDYVAPADGPVTSGYGPRWGTQHHGIDIAAPHGAPIRSVAAGRVVEAGPATGFGNWVRIQHPSGEVTVYGHMATYHVTTGQQVATGQQIAEVGSEGQSTGPHLHFEVWPHGDRAARIDPAPWLAARGVQL